jgi:hypothetical protein
MIERPVNTIRTDASLARPPITPASLVCSGNNVTAMMAAHVTIPINGLTISKHQYASIKMAPI